MTALTRDENNIAAIGGASTLGGRNPVPIQVNPATGAMLTETTIDTGDIEIGAVEIKNSTDDTRATVDTNGLYVNPRTGLTLLPFDYVSMTISPTTTETYTFKSGGASGTVTNTVVIVYTDSTRSDISTVTKT